MVQIGTKEENAAPVKRKVIGNPCKSYPKDFMGQELNGDFKVKKDCNDDDHYKITCPCTNYYIALYERE